MAARPSLSQLDPISWGKFFLATTGSEKDGWDSSGIGLCDDRVYDCIRRCFARIITFELGRGKFNSVSLDSSYCSASFSYDKVVEEQSL